MAGFSNCISDKAEDPLVTDKPAPREGEILLYTGPGGHISVEVLFEEESFWLTQKRMAELFEVTVPTINEHLKNVSTAGRRRSSASGPPRYCGNSSSRALSSTMKG